MAQVNWDEKEVAKRKSDRYLGKKDKIDRICIMDKEAEMELIHYVGGYVKCTAYKLIQKGEAIPNTNPPIPADKPKIVKCLPCLFCNHTGKDPEERYGANIIVYSTDRDGMPLNPMTFDLTWWSFSSGKFRQLRTMKQNYGDLRGHDLVITCTNDTYQHLEIQCMPDAWWLKNEPFKAMVVAEYATRKRDLSKLLGDYYPLERQDEYIARAVERENKKAADDRRSRGGEAAPPSTGSRFHGHAQTSGPDPFSMPATVHSPVGGFPPPAAPPFPSVPTGPSTTMTPVATQTAQATTATDDLTSLQPQPTGETPDLDAMLQNIQGG